MVSAYAKELHQVNRVSGILRILPGAVCFLSIVVMLGIYIVATMINKKVRLFPMPTVSETATFVPGM